MLSRLILKKALLNDAGNSSMLALVGVRHFKNVPPGSNLPSDSSDIQKVVANWDYANQLFFGPKRDHKNFPLIKQPEYCPPTRLGFLPETWFQNLYDKTGVTGPYALGVGLITFLMSKEIVIVEHQFSHFVCFWIAFYGIYRKFGDRISQYLQKKGDHLDEVLYYKPMRDAKGLCQENIDNLEKGIWREEGQKQLFESKRENVDLQLESIYRQRLAEVHQAVKRRLDYHVEVDNLHKRTEQQNMVDWITKSVVKSITPQQEKESLVKCIADLKSLAAKQQASLA